MHIWLTLNYRLNIDSALKDAKKTLTEWQNSFTELANSSLVTIDQGSSINPIYIEIFVTISRQKCLAH
jgi:hypothetical protein